jgi:hypothetical protein
MSSRQDVLQATRTKLCSQTELDAVVQDMVTRAEATGIDRLKIGITMRTHGPVRRGVAGMVIFGAIAGFMTFGLVSLLWGPMHQEAGARIGSILLTLASWVLFLIAVAYWRLHQPKPWKGRLAQWARWLDGHGRTPTG